MRGRYSGGSLYHMPYDRAALKLLTGIIGDKKGMGIITLLIIFTRMSSWYHPIAFASAIAKCLLRRLALKGLP